MLTLSNFRMLAVLTAVLTALTAAMSAPTWARDHADLSGRSAAEQIEELDDQSAEADALDDDALDEEDPLDGQEELDSCTWGPFYGANEILLEEDTETVVWDGEPAESDEELAADDEACAPPALSDEFLSRTWALRGDLVSLDGSQLNFDILSNNIFEPFEDEAELLDDQAAVALLSAQTKVVVKRGGVERPASRRSLRRARDVKVIARVLPADRWSDDEDGYKLVTVKAQKVIIVR